MLLLCFLKGFLCIRLHVLLCVCEMCVLWHVVCLFVLFVLLFCENVLSFVKSHYDSYFVCVFYYVLHPKGPLYMSLSQQQPYDFYHIVTSIMSCVLMLLQMWSLSMWMLDGGGAPTIKAAGRAGQQQTATERQRKIQLGGDTVSQTRRRDSKERQNTTETQPRWQRLVTITETPGRLRFHPMYF